MSKLRKPSLHPLFREALQEGAKESAIRQKTVRVLSKVVAETMEELHGGQWRVQIDHEAGFVLIVPKLGEVI